MLKIGLCDDQSPFHETMRQMLEQTLQTLRAGPYQLDLYTDAAALTKAVTEDGIRYHILLLDIMLGKGDNGIQTAVRLQELHDLRASVIFVSAHPQYAIESFQASPLYFLTKPVQEEQLLRAMGNALKKWQEDATLELTDVNKAVHAVRLGDIEYLEIYDKRFVVHVSDATGRTRALSPPEESEIVCRSDIEAVMARLPEPRFFRCHRNFLVNMGQVKSIAKSALQIRSGVSIPVARRKYEDVLLAYTQNRGGTI